MLSFTQSKKALQASSYVLLAGLLMGNQGCEQEEEVVPPRQLKWRAEVGQMQASPFNLPGGGSFDFQFAANAQLTEVLHESGLFSVSYNSRSGGSSGPAYFGFEASDRDLYQTWSGQSLYETYNQGGEDIACIVERPQMRISGKIYSFEATGGLGIGASVGYGPNGTYDTSFLPSANLNIDFAQLDLALFAFNAITKDGEVFASSRARANQTKVSLGLTIDFGLFRLGPSAYFQSPLSEVTHRAITMASDDLAGQIKGRWFTRVISPYRSNDSHLVILGGENVGLQVGDKIAVHNEQHLWAVDGAPCRSAYMGGIQSPQPSVMAVIESVGTNMSRAKIDPFSWTQNVDYGAKVFLHEFAQ